MLLKYNFYRKGTEEERIQKVILRATKEASIEKLIFCIDITKIKELTIIDSTSRCALNDLVAEKISLMVNLRVLRIFWADCITDEMAMSMLKYLINL